MYYIGCDIAKNQIDVTIYPDKYQRFDNDLEGHQKLSQFIPANSFVCMESTSTYFKPIAMYLKQRGHTVYVVNPLKVKRYAQSKLRRLKTDKADSWVIADYLIKFQAELEPWHSTEFAHALVVAVVRVADSMMVAKGGQATRTKAFAFAHPEIAITLESAQMALQKEQDKFYTLARKFIHADELLSSWYKALIKLPGFGESLTTRFLGHCTDLRRFKSGRHFASFCGITPSDVQSGGVNKQAHISRIGSPALRTILFLAAQGASKSKSKYGDLYKRLISQNKSKYRAYTALGNRLARAAWAVCVKPQDED
jgi:transposase